MKKTKKQQKEYQLWLEETYPGDEWYPYKTEKDLEKEFEETKEIHETNPQKRGCLIH